MSAEHDLEIIETQPLVKLWGESLDELDSIKRFKGKFVMTGDGKFFAKLYPESEWETCGLYHDMVVRELGVGDPESLDVKDVVIGGGKIAVELLDNRVECRLWGKSTIYGDYDPEHVPSKALLNKLREVFDLDETPIEVIRDYEE